MALQVCNFGGFDRETDMSLAVEAAPWRADFGPGAMLAALENFGVLLEGSDKTKTVRSIIHYLGRNSDISKRCVIALSRLGERQREKASDPQIPHASRKRGRRSTLTPPRGSNHAPHPPTPNDATTSLATLGLNLDTGVVYGNSSLSDMFMQWPAGAVRELVGRRPLANTVPLVRDEPAMRGRVVEDGNAGHFVGGAAIAFDAACAAAKAAGPRYRCASKDGDPCCARTASFYTSRAKPKCPVCDTKAGAAL